MCVIWICHRTIPPHIRRALEERDRGCRFPGCACRFTGAHHMEHWADGGETSLGNTLLLCRRHHRAVHEGRVKVSVNRDGTVLFFTPKGQMLADAPKGRGPVPSAHRGAPSTGKRATLSNGAALYRDSAMPWTIEAAVSMAIENVTLLAIENVALRGLTCGGSGATGAGQPAKCPVTLMRPAPRPTATSAQFCMAGNTAALEAMDESLE